jgi:hypothetical protein
MSGNLKLNTALGGSIALTPTNTASNITVTIPATTGTLLTTATAGVPIGGPAFSAYLSANQTGIASATQTKVALNVEDFDTNNCFSTANSRFTPTVAGYYQFNGVLYFSGTGSYTGCTVFKNGVANISGSATNANSGEVISTVSCILYLNGTTDYVELYGFSVLVAGTGTFTATSTRFSGALVRSAT